MFSKTDEKYEILYYKYSKIKLDNQRLKEKHKEEIDQLKFKINEDIAKNMINLFQYIEIAKENSFKVEATNPEIQRLLMDINKAEKEIKKIMKGYYVEEIIPSERMFDPDLHEVSSYSDAKGMVKGLILKTTKKGFKFKNKTIKKPKVVVTK